MPEKRIRSNLYTTNCPFSLFQNHRVNPFSVTHTISFCYRRRYSARDVLRHYPHAFLSVPHASFFRSSFPKIIIPLIQHTRLIDTPFFLSRSSLVSLLAFGTLFLSFDLYRYSPFVFVVCDYCFFIWLAPYWWDSFFILIYLLL